MRRGVRGLAMALCLIAPAVHIAAQPSDDRRVDLPIREVILSDGTRRYAVAVTIGGREITAGLDTGSIGLRVLADAVDPATRVVGASRRYGYGSGTVLVGPATEAEIGFGGLAKTTTFQRVMTIACAKDRPGCPASRVPPGGFGIQGDGLDGEGFRAILGIGMGQADLPNPLSAVGATRWIVRLPRPGEAGAGHLILNPSADEIAGFTVLTRADVGPAHDAIAACLSLPQAATLCAPTILDSGAPGIDVVNSRTGTPPPGEVAARLLFAGRGDSPAAGIAFVTGQRAQASRLAFVSDPQSPDTRIRSGLLVYFGYDVLYRPAGRSIAVKARPPYTDGVIALPPPAG